MCEPNCPQRELRQDPVNTLGCCHLKSHIDSDVVDDFPSALYPVDHASQVLPAFQDGRPVHSLRVAHRSIRVPGSVGNYFEQLAQNARSALKSN